MRLRARLAGALCAALAASAAAAHTGDEQVAALLAGEWNNNEQVWQQRIDIADPKVATKPALSDHVHRVVWRLKSSALGEQLLFVQPSAGDDLGNTRAPYLLRLTRAADNAVKLETLRLREPARWAGAHRRADTATTLTAADVLTEPACDVVLKLDAASSAWTGSPPAGACAEATNLSMGAERWAAGSINSRKARYYTGWLWFRNAGPGSSPEDKDTSFTARFQLHNEGQKVTVLRNDGSETPWAVELALLTYQNTRRPILKLALVDRATGKSITYTWTDVDGRTLGMNIGWFQSGLTVKAENAAFGF